MVHMILVHNLQVVIVDIEYLAHYSDLSGGRGDSWQARTKGWVQTCNEGVVTNFIRLFGHAPSVLLIPSSEGAIGPPMAIQATESTLWAEIQLKRPLFCTSC